MTNDDAEIRLDLDTKSAQGKLKDLNKKAALTGKGVRRGVSRGMGSMGMGGATLGAGAAVTGAISGGAGDVIAGALNPLTNWLKGHVFGGMDMNAAATKQAFSDVVTPSVARLAKKDPGVIERAAPRFRQVKKRHLEAAQGFRDFQNTPAFQTQGAHHLRFIKENPGEGAKAILKGALQHNVDIIKWVYQKFRGK